MNLPKKLIRISLPYYLVLLSFTASCGNRNESNQALRSIRYSSIITKVCPSDTMQSYDVYLPTSYSLLKKWPVIYVFDPHGDGKLAVNHFKEAAERYGYIILGSNNSRNGLPTLDHTLDILMKDSKTEFAIDVNRQYAGGFSGGGRVAFMLATQHQNIKGIITCSAGLPGFNPLSAPAKFDIYAIAGREDFNYDEVMSIQQQFANTDWRTITTAFDGGHAWPPANYISSAVLWFQLNAMRDGVIPKNDEILSQTLDSFKIRCQKYMDDKQFVSAANECKMGISFLAGQQNTKKLEKKLREIQTQNDYINELKNAEQLQSMEEQLKRGYMQSFSTQDISWWKNELNGLTSSTNQSIDISTKQMYRRVKGFLGIVCYSYTAQAIQENNETQAAKCLEIYETLEPKNPDCFYYKALFLDKKSLHSEAAESLKKAVEYGFKDLSKARLQLSKKTLQIVELHVK